MRGARSATPGGSPLDERLGLLPGSALTPWLIEGIVRLGAVMPFAQVPAVRAHFTGVRVGAETVRRLTEAAGAAQVARETENVVELERGLPDAPLGPCVQLFSVDGAMVPLVGGDWAEVKTLVVGEVASEDGRVRTTDLSYFSRLADAETFGRLATTETHRRGTSTASPVVAVTDGARWCQGVIDLQRPDAVRIRDFPHAVEHRGQVAQAVFGSGTAAGSAWVGVQAGRLRQGHEAAVLAALTDLLATPTRATEVATVIAGTRAYLATRQAQIRYQTFGAAGYPIGSGAVQSANKVVGEARLKGAGKHWARPNVDPMRALRTVLANDRWAEEWPTLGARLRRPPRRKPPAPTPPVAIAPIPLSPDPAAATPPALARPKTIVNGKPTADHPWKRGLLSRAKT